MDKWQTFDAMADYYQAAADLEMALRGSPRSQSRLLLKFLAEANKCLCLAEDHPECPLHSETPADLR